VKRAASFFVRCQDGDDLFSQSPLALAALLVHQHLGKLGEDADVSVAEAAMPMQTPAPVAVPTDTSGNCTTRGRRKAGSFTGQRAWESRRSRQ
jgi:hypothetical protein